MGSLRGPPGLAKRQCTNARYLSRRAASKPKTFEQTAKEEQVRALIPILACEEACWSFLIIGLRWPLLFVAL